MSWVAPECRDEGVAFGVVFDTRDDVPFSMVPINCVSVVSASGRPRSRMEVRSATSAILLMRWLEKNTVHPSTETVPDVGFAVQPAR